MGERSDRTPVRRSYMSNPGICAPWSSTKALTPTGEEMSAVYTILGELKNLVPGSYWYPEIQELKLPVIHERQRVRQVDRGVVSSAWSWGGTSKDMGRAM